MEEKLFTYNHGDPITIVNPVGAIEWVRARLATVYGNNVYEWPEDLMRFYNIEAETIIKAAGRSDLVCLIHYSDTGTLSLGMEEGLKPNCEFPFACGHIPAEFVAPRRTGDDYSI